MKNRYKSHTEVVSIDEIKNNLNQIRKKYFSKSELLELETRHIQSLAGFYATKIALKKIIVHQYKNQNISENQIILKHNKNGAPVISKIISYDIINLKNYKISISHTSENAYGCATFMEKIE